MYLISISHWICIGCHKVRVSYDDNKEVNTCTTYQLFKISFELDGHTFKGSLAQETGEAVRPVGFGMVKMCSLGREAEGCKWVWWAWPDIVGWCSV